GECIDGALAAGVGGLVQGAGEGGAGADVGDGATAGLEHGGDGVLAHQHGAPGVDGEHAVPQFDVHVQYVRVVHQALAGGVVVQGVDTPKGVEGELHQRLDAAFIGDVHAAVGHLAVLGHLGGGVGHVEAGQVGDHHPGAAGGEALGGGKADAALG